MKMDMTLFAGLAGLIAIAAALGAQSYAAPQSTSHMVPASFTPSRNCPDAQSDNAVGTLAEPPVGSLALVLL